MTERINQITRDDILNCGPHDSFIAISKRAGLEIRQILGDNSAFFDLRNLVLTGIADGEKVRKSVFFYNPPKPAPPGKNGDSIGAFHVIFSIAQRKIVLLCTLLDDCPHRDGSLRYTILVMQAMPIEQYRY